MKNNIYVKEPPPRLRQKCPLCGHPHPACVRGIVYDMDDGSPTVCGDKGYSFCNCRNIFYTDWKNIRQDSYDEAWVKRYDNDNIKNEALNESKKIYSVLMKINPDIHTFFEIGSVHDHVLGYMSENGISVSGLDISGRKSKYFVECFDFDTFKPKESYDILWASHVLEHLHYPIDAISKMKRMLNHHGLLYIAMPDTFFIDWQGALLNWDWIVSEHHIMWDMDSFIELMEERGFVCHFKERNTDMFKNKDGSMFWKKDMKMVFGHA